MGATAIPLHVDLGDVDQIRAAFKHVADEFGRLDASAHIGRSEEHTSELQSLMRISYAVFCLKKKKDKYYYKYKITHSNDKYVLLNTISEQLPEQYILTDKTQHAYAQYTNKSKI